MILASYRGETPQLNTIHELVLYFTLGRIHELLITHRSY